MTALRAIVLVVLGATAWLACAGSVPSVTDQHALVAARRWPGTTRADLELGRERYVNRCSSCHALFPPGRFPASTWHQMVGEMAKRAKLDARDQEVVLRYLLTFARTDEVPGATGARAPAARTDR
jgi:hypothetical protein